MSNMPVEVQRAQSALSIKADELASVMWTVARVAHQPSMPTAATDGVNIFVGDWFCAQSIQHRAGILAHEVMHVILGDCAKGKLYSQRGKGPAVEAKQLAKWQAFAQQHGLPMHHVPFNREIFNIAADDKINSALKADGFMLPAGCLLDARYPHTMPLHDIYMEIFMEKYNPQGKPEQGEDGEGEGEGEGGQGNGGGKPEQGQGGDEIGNEMFDDVPESFDEHIEPDDQAEADAEKTEKEVKRAIEDALASAKQKGSGTSAVASVIGELLEPAKIPWFVELRKYMRQTFKARRKLDNRKLNRKQAGIMAATGRSMPIMPKRTGEEVGDIVIQLDTSGSVSPDELNSFLSEVSFIGMQLNPRSLTILYVDAEVCHVDKIEKQSEMRQLDKRLVKTGRHGYGGSDMGAGVRWCAEQGVKPAVFITFTDGYVDWAAAPDYPTIVVTTCKKGPAYSKTLEV